MEVSWTKYCLNWSINNSKHQMADLVGGEGRGSFSGWPVPFDFLVPGNCTWDLFLNKKKCSQLHLVIIILIWRSDCCFLEETEFVYRKCYIPLSPLGLQKRMREAIHEWQATYTQGWNMVKWNLKFCPHSTRQCVVPWASDLPVKW